MDTKALIQKYSNMVTDLKWQQHRTSDARISANIEVEITTLLMVIEDLEKLEKGDAAHV